MNVLIISQCSKKALTETRRLLDQFAERKGERTWQTAITWQGLTTLRKLLRKTAKRNTAVACHWIKKANCTELLWIVGNIRQFNDQGTVPTNMTTQDILRRQDENLWHTTEDIALLAGIAGLFHDFGKANKLFQQKLKSSQITSEPYRHEWLSLRLFEALVGQQNDVIWLEKLAHINADEESQLLENLVKDSSTHTSVNNPFATLPPLAKTIGWLIVSHHRLPKFPTKDTTHNQPQIKHIAVWMTHNKDFNGSWNSQQCNEARWDKAAWQNLWQFPHGTPVRSKTWRTRAQHLAQRALKQPSLIKDWLIQDNFSAHLARLTLMLADHCYSMSSPTVSWQDEDYQAYANTDRKSGALKQKLDEHNVGVGRNAVYLAKNLPKIRQTLPAITRHKGFKKRTTIAKFRWQDKAYDLACGIRERSAKQGFFGINMASTGCGKTLANGRIMYGLADEKLGCRFSIALGLRTLTLQTGDALRKRLHLAKDDLAVFIGSQSVQLLHEYKNNPNENSGSESAEEFFAEHQYVSYDGSLDDGRLNRWLKQSPKLHQLISAPILVSTIDHLIPATEGERGGKQIAPMLRLLTADLVLDEPDDFDLADLPALTRLVNWAGMLGSRVLLSSATLPPSLVEALFDAYAAGRKIYQSAVGEPNLPLNICCAWFDEYTVRQSDHVQRDDFMSAHTAFVEQRVKQLTKATPLRLAKIHPITNVSNKSEDVIAALSSQIATLIPQLHNAHHQMNSDGKRISIGLVRMANINPLVAVAQELFTYIPPSNYHIHYCVYHSQHPLAIRSFMEKQLDEVLNRSDENKIWQTGSITKALDQYAEDNHIFVVLATGVAEVGRDHDYDWAIAEPSSMRSLIQLAGRIQRHRQKLPQETNFIVLSKNYRALKGENIAYTRPGFESGTFPLESHDLSEILLPEQLEHINAVPRIQRRAHGTPRQNLADLEHHHLHAKLFGDQITYYASLWWQHHADWCFEIQRYTPFRQSAKDELFVLYFAEAGDEARFHVIDMDGSPKLAERYFQRLPPIQWAPQVHPWFQLDFNTILSHLADIYNKNLDETCKQFGEIRLREGEWFYHSLLGVFGALK